MLNSGSLFLDLVVVHREILLPRYRISESKTKYVLRAIVYKLAGRKDTETKLPHSLRKCTANSQTILI